MKNLFLAGALALVAACSSGPTIRSHVDPAANLSSYKTFMFAERTGTDRPEYQTPITSYFKESIRREMEARGYRYVEGGPADLLVNFNANARERAIVMHGAPYVSADVAAAQGRLGRSWGCPALREAVARQVIDTIRGGGVVFSYYPDQRWLESSRFLNCDDTQTSPPALRVGRTASS